MFTIRVAPISRGTSAEELTYWSAVEYAVGAIIRVPVRGREVFAAVVASDPVRDAKASVRRSGFALRKLPRQVPHAHMLPEFVRAAGKTARWFATTTGAVLYAHVPKSLYASDKALPHRTANVKPHLRGYIVPRVYQGLAASRIEFYRGSVREAFASNGSVLIITPTLADATRVFTALSGGIERYSYLLTSAQSLREQRARTQAALESEHPVLVVATGSYMSLPRHDVLTIIVERESSPLYRDRARPYADTRMLAHHFAAELGGQLFLADLPLRIDSIFRKDQGEYEEVVTGAQRTTFDTPVTLVAMKGESRPPKGQFRTVGRELASRIKAATHERKGVFLYVARRGLSPVTLCGDCGLVVACNECGASVVLHKGKEENYFLCHSCGALRHARERCAACQSWRLETFGIGTELVEREVSGHLSDVPVSVLTSDTAKTHTAALRIVNSFLAEGGVLIGTELALPYLSEPVPLVGVVSLDSLLSLSSWNVYERIAGTLTRLREMAREAFVVQTRHPNADILETVLQGNFSGYYKSELRMRKELGYPPYTVLIKVSITGTQGAITQYMEEAKAVLLPYDLIPFSRILKAPGGQYSLHGFLRVSRATWPDDALIARLALLSPAFTIVVDPDSIL